VLLSPLLLLLPLLLLQLLDLPAKVSAGLTSMVASAVYDMESFGKVRTKRVSHQLCLHCYIVVTVAAVFF
jgi:hypothetical protein